MNIFLKKFVKESFKRPGSALDLGCGEGFDVACLRHLGWEAKGIDKEDCDLNKPYKEVKQYDLVYSNYVLPFITNKDAFIGTIYHNLKNNGNIFIATFSKEDPVFKTEGKTKEELSAMFTDRFSAIRDVKIDEHDVYDNDEGHKHWHKVLILTAKKQFK